MNNLAQLPMKTHTHIEIEPFEPHLLMRNPHTQTIAGANVRPQTGIAFRRERVELPDGDFVDLDFADVKDATWADLGNYKPIVMMIHGLEGNARSGPAHEIYRYLARRGVRCLGMNLRSCSGEMNRTAKLYHAGSTEDIAYVHGWLEERFPNTQIGFVGISLGANMLLKYLGENGDSLQDRLVAGVAISPPFDMHKGNEVLGKGAGLLYARHLLRSLKAKALQKRPLVGDTIDMKAVEAADNFRDFDAAFTAPLHGFADWQDYYSRTSSKNFLSDIRVPTLLLRAVDDPFFDPTDIPYDAVEANEFLYGGFPQHGGHVGFIEGFRPGNYTYWAERQAARFLALVV